MPLPIQLAIESVELKSNSPTILSEGRNLVTLTRTIPTHRWEMTLKSVNLSSLDSRAVSAWVNSLGGRNGTFTAVIPEISSPKGAATGSPVVSGSHAIGVGVVSASAFAANVVGQLKAGDMLKFANHSKVYQVTQDVSSSATGSATVNIYPKLMKAVPAGTALTIKDVPFLLRLDNDIQEYKLSANNSGFVRLELDCIEVL
jgi:hypothetical protein